MLRYQSIATRLLITIFSFLTLAGSSLSFCEVRVSASVSKSTDTLIYLYTIKNLSTGSQRIDDFAVDFLSPIYYSRIPAVRLSPPSWWGQHFADTNIFGWASHYDSTDIVGGDSLSGYKLFSFGLPCIANSYSWYYTEPDIGEGDENDSTTIFDSAMIQKTIVPADPSTPFNALAFLDTLISYMTHARTLGWITTQSTADKYAGLFARAKSDIQAAKVPSARTRLDTVLVQVKADSGAMLTSEAYALLRFNTEYLVRMLAK